MADHEPTIRDDVDQHGEALDAELLPEEFPEDRPLASRDYGTTEAEQARREPLDRRLRREEPDFGAAVDEENGDDTDGEGDADADGPDLLSQAGEDGRDVTKELVAERSRRDRHPDDSGQPRSPRSAEEDAVHLVEEEDDVAEEEG